MRLDGDTIELETTDVGAFARCVAPVSVGVGARLREVRPLDEDLESVFRYLVDR